MPCWYYEKHELESTASLRDGIDPDIESRYRREGARFIIDTGIKMGLRYDTCATGVVYFHRFYMFHSFREFHRYVTGACCLFLAGKVEETPKKCKDIVKMARSLLTDAQFIVFGEDPKEEVMTLERILLQTIKFDLQVEHPYALLLKFAQVLKSDKGKVQKMVQMAWTFVNDSLCTTLCLQWEPNIVSVALMYLAARLSKVEITEWEGKPPGYRGKWWEFFLEEATLDLLEDVCHQVLDLYSSNPKKGEESPPPSAAKLSPAPPQLQASHTPMKKTSPNTPVSSSTQSSSSKPKSHVSLSKQKKPSGNKRQSSRSPSPKAKEKKPRQLGKDPVSVEASQRLSEKPSDTEAQVPPVQNAGGPVGPGMSYSSTYQQYQGSEGYSYPYGTQQMYSSSFMSQEGSQSIQSLIGHGSNSTSSYTQPSGTSGQYTQPMTQYSQGAYQGQFQQGYQQAGYQQSQTGFQQQQYYNQQEFAAGSYGNQQASYQQNYQQQQSGYANQSYDNSQYGYNNQTGQTYPPQPPSGAPPLPTTPAVRGSAPPAPPHQPAAPGQGGSTGLATVRITGRR